jgi:hypothetical protein
MCILWMSTKQLSITFTGRIHAYMPIPIHMHTNIYIYIYIYVIISVLVNLNTCCVGDGGCLV